MNTRRAVLVVCVVLAGGCRERSTRSHSDDADPEAGKKQLEARRAREEEERVAGRLKEIEELKNKAEEERKKIVLLELEIATQQDAEERAKLQKQLDDAKRAAGIPVPSASATASGW